MSHIGLRFAVASTCATIFFAGCTHDAWIGAELPASISNGGGGGGSAGAAGSGGVSGDAAIDAAKPCVQVKCSGQIYACGNCKDDDGDGKVDMNDPECLSPCQDTERTFANERPGQGHGACILDCYFDQDSGFGNDDCIYSHECDALSVAPDYPPEGPRCAYDPATKLPRNMTCAAPQSDKCRSVCAPLTPNGCDCFGCCKAPGASTAVFSGSVDDNDVPSCDFEHLADPTRCKPCTQVASCINTCDPCELCFGARTVAQPCGTSAPTCAVPQCLPGATPCNSDCLPPCAAGLSCVTGCCIEPPR